jgi:hypothetical protein
MRQTDSGKGRESGREQRERMDNSQKGTQRLGERGRGEELLWKPHDSAHQVHSASVQLEGEIGDLSVDFSFHILLML